MVAALLARVVILRQEVVVREIAVQKVALLGNFRSRRS
jgi:hypothetical protein